MSRCFSHRSELEGPYLMSTRVKPNPQSEEPERAHAST